jgi:hypothetical protein
MGEPLRRLNQQKELEGAIGQVRGRLEQEQEAQRKIEAEAQRKAEVAKRAEEMDRQDELAKFEELGKRPVMEYMPGEERDIRTHSSGQSDELAKLND